MTAPESALSLLRRERDILVRLARIDHNNGLLGYRPHPKQELFYTAADKIYRYARTGNRFGKSEMGAAEDVAFALGYRPWYPIGHPLRTLGIPSHPTKGLIVTADWGKSKEVFTEDISDPKGKLFKYIPHDKLGTVTKNHSGYIDCIRVKHISGGWSSIHLDTVKSFKQNPLGQESSFWDWIHVDEPIPEKMWTANARGLVDRRGKAWFTCTPLTEPWLDIAFIPDSESLSKESITFESEKRWMMTGTMYDNPYNTPEAIADFESWITDEERECRLYGLPTAYAGLIYKEFRHEIHVHSAGLPEDWTSWANPPHYYTRRFAIDYHFRKNDAVLFIATAPSGRCFVYHEIWQQLLVEDEVKAIKDVHAGHTFLPGLIDPLALTPNKINESTAMEEFLRHGLPVFPATKDPVNGIRTVKALLKSRDRYGNPILNFAPHLKRTLFEISRGYVWKEDENKPNPVNNDMMENLYRLCLQGLHYVDPTDNSDYGSIERRSDFTTDFDPTDPAGERKTRDHNYANRYRS
jgi:hypothetical protein